MTEALAPWWIPLTLCFGLAVCFYFVHTVQERRTLRNARSYRSRYLQLISQLERVTTHANSLAQGIASIRDSRVLDYYESSLKMMEVLMEALKKLPPFHKEAGILDSAFYLVEDCRSRFTRADTALQALMRGQPVDFDWMVNKPKSAAIKHVVTEKSGANGCYFCSRPPQREGFERVRVKLDGEVREVDGCSVCRHELQFTKKVKVLYFLRDGKPVHWADVPHYTPSEDYWNINSRGGQRKPVRLELVTAQDASTRNDESLN